MSEIMPEICDFINSRDVRSYLQEINYQFTSPEAAFVVYWSKRTVKDKISVPGKASYTATKCTGTEKERFSLGGMTGMKYFFRNIIYVLNIVRSMNVMRIAIRS